MVTDELNSVYSVFSQVVRFHYYRVHVLLEKLSLYPGQPALLFMLGKQGGLSQKELAKKLHVTDATVTVMLRRMAKARLVERRQDQHDQRITRVYLTDQGEKTLIQVKELFKVIETECFSGFTPEEQILLRRLLMQMRDNLKKVNEVDEPAPGLKPAASEGPTA